MNNSIKKAIPIALAVTGSIGTIATAVLVAKETPKTNDELAKISEEDNKKRFLKKSSVVIKYYWPAILCGVGTIGSIVASTIITKKTEASLIATATMLGQGWNRYKYKIKELFGAEANDRAANSISKDEYEKLKETSTRNTNLYYEEHLGFFECDKVRFMAALNDLNQRLHVPDADDKGTFYWTTLTIFAKDAKAILKDQSKLEACKNIGWTSDYLGEAYGMTGIWIHPYYTKVYDKNSKQLLYTKVEFWEEPIVLAESELSRFHYKSRADFEHEAECDINADMYIDEYLLYSKPDCNIKDDELDHLMLSDPEDSSNTTDIYEGE